MTEPFKFVIANDKDKARYAIDAHGGLRETRKTITVGTGADFATINEALQVASRFASDYTFDVQRLEHFRVEIRLLAGFVMAEQVFVVGQDLGYVHITSVDAVVPITRSALNQNYGGSGQNWRNGTFPAFCAARGARLPVIKALFEMDTSGDGIGTVGVYVFENSSAVIFRNCGVKGAGWRGLYVDGGYAYARDTIWDGSGFAGGPEGFSGGVRASNGAVVMARGASAKNCAAGGYWSAAYGTVADADFSGATGIGLGVQGGSKVVGAATKADNCGTYGFYVANGSDFYNGRSSDTGLYPSAQNCATSAVFVEDGSVYASARGTYTATGPAIDVRTASRAVCQIATVTSSGSRGLAVSDGSEANVQSSIITGSGDWGARLYGGSRLFAQDAKIGGASGGVQLNSGSLLFKNGATALDGTSDLVCNVRAGEYSPNGAVFGADERTTLYSADASTGFSGASTREQIILTGNLTGARSFTLYDSTNYASRRHTLAHAGTGTVAYLFQPNGTTKIAALYPGESVTVAANGSGGWMVISRARLPYLGRTVGNGNVTMVPTWQFIRNSTTITGNYSITMYAAGDGAAHDHTFSRNDSGSGVWTVYEPDGTTAVAIVAAGQWVQIAPQDSGSAWYVAARGVLNVASRVGTVASSATPTINFDLVDQFNITSLATAITSMSNNLSGTPQDGDQRRIRFKDNGTAQAIVWGASFTGNLLSVTVPGKTHLQELIYDAAQTKWVGTYCDRLGDGLTAAPAADPLASGFATIPRWAASSSSAALPASGTMQLTYLPADKTQPVSTVYLRTGTTAAAATPTLCRIGLFSVAANGDLTLIASTVNDTTLFAATSTNYSKAFSAAAGITAGDRLALGILVISGAALPTFAGGGAPGSSETAVGPRSAGQVSGLSDLPSTVANASISANNAHIYARVA